MRLLCLALLFSPAASFATCADQTIMTCRIGSKQLSVCQTGTTVTYAFGPKGALEMSLAEPVETVDFVPWAGVSSAIWQSVAFANGDITYEVWDSVQRSPESKDPRAGGVVVWQNDDMLAELTCDQGSVTGTVDLLYDAKSAAGLCWNAQAFDWQSCANN